MINIYPSPSSTTVGKSASNYRAQHAAQAPDHSTEGNVRGPLLLVGTDTDKVQDTMLYVNSKSDLQGKRDMQRSYSPKIHAGTASPSPYSANNEGIQILRSHFVS
jgi:hypothetical protein